MKEIIWKKRWVAYFAAFFCNFLWGSAFSFVKIGYEQYQVAENDPASQILFAGCRFFLAGLFTLIAVSLASKKVCVPKRGSYHKVVCLSLFQTVLQYFFFYIGLAHTTGVKATILCTFQVFFSILLSALIFRMEHMTVLKVLGCLLGLAGVILVNVNGIDSVDFLWNGEGFIIICAMAGGTSSVLMKHFSDGENPVVLSGWQFALGGLVMIVVSMLLGGRLAAPTLPAVLVLVYLAFLSAAAYGMWSVLLKYHPVSKITVFCFANPLCGVILSSILLKEDGLANGILIAVALVLVCVGIYLVNRQPLEKAKKEKQAS